MIHAWLDGALPADEASRVEAHARDCAQCAAMVAEARGFIAGSTRIVSSLDVVPGNVIPGPPATTAAPVTARNSAWKRLKLTPARAAIAATILVGVASMFSVRHRDFQESSAREQVTTSTSPTVAERAVAPSAPAAVEGVAAAPAPAVAPPAAGSAGAVRREAKRAVPADTERTAMAAARESADRAKAAVDSNARRQLAEAITTNVAPQKSAAAGAPASPPAGLQPSAASAAAPNSLPAIQQPSVAQGRFARRVPANAPPAAASSDMMIRPEGCYAIDQQGDVDLHGFPMRFELAHDSSSGNVVRALSVAGAARSAVDGATWETRAGNAVVITVKSPAAGAQLDLQFSLGDSTLRVTDRGVQRSTRLTRIDCGR
jgi:hypothetical protein